MFGRRKLPPLVVCAFINIRSELKANGKLFKNVYEHMLFFLRHNLKAPVQSAPLKQRILNITFRDFKKGF